MKLASIFTNHMVFQANKPIQIFGEGKGTAEIDFFGQKYQIYSKDESWCVTLPEYNYGGPYSMRITLDGKLTVLEDIYIGEVWFAGGQSNMEMPLFRTDGGFDEAKYAKNNKIRFFTVPRRMERNTVSCGWHFEKTISVDTPWQICNRETALHFSAIGYYTAKELCEKLDVAVGIISCNWGGRNIESFIKREYFYDTPALKPIIEEYNQKIKEIDFSDYMMDFKADIHRWEIYYNSIDFDEVNQAGELGLKATSGMIPGMPEMTYGKYAPYTPGSLYDSMIARIVPFVFRGVLWYHGEANCSGDYYEKCTTFMRCMREVFKDSELPFYLIELAGFHNYTQQDTENEISDRFVTDNNTAFIREDQQRIADNDKNAYLVTSMCLEDLYDIHPPYKKELSHRLSMKILKYSYGYDIYADQPVFESAKFFDGKAYIKLKNADGLFAKRLSSVKMYLADETRKLKRANIVIENDSLILSSPEVRNPILARYAFDFYYLGCHIFNKAGLPLAPFRTDRSY